VVAEAVQGTVNPKGEDIAAYTIHTNGQVEFTFLEAVESVGAVDEQIDVNVYINENSVDEEFAYITPIEAEEPVSIPLFIEEEETEKDSEKSTEEEKSAKKDSEESTEEDEERQGFSLAIEEALNDDGEVFTEEEGHEPEDTLTLRIQSNLKEDQNYQAEDVEV